MADDNNLPDPSALKASTTGLQNLNTVQKQVYNQRQRDQQQQVKTNSLTSKFTQLLDRNNRSLKQVLKSTDDVNTSFDEMDKSLISITDQIVDFTLKGKKGALGMQVEVKRLAEDMIGLAKKAEDTNKELDNQQKAYKVLGEKMRGVDKQIREMEKQKKSGAVLDKQQEEHLKKLKKDMNDHRITLQKYEGDIEKTALALHHQNQEFVEAHQRMLTNIKDMRAGEREAQRLKGGFGAIKAELGELYDSKMFQMLDKGVWLIALKKAFDYFSMAYSKVGEMYEKQALLQRQYGVSGKTGMEGVTDAAVEAEANAVAFVKTAARLHMELDKVRDIGTKIQQENLGIFGARSAKEVQENVRNLTDATSEFARVTGVDGVEAVDLLKRRTEDMGLTAKQAAADMRQMVTVLSQMQVGVQGDVVGMDEMIKLVEKASATSGSFVVDTRLMTQAMRAAANEAERLGGSKKLALETATAMGKVAQGSSGEGGGGFLSGPVANITTGLDVTEIVRKGGQEYQKLLSSLTDEQKKYVEGVRQELLNNQIENVEAAGLLDQEIGGTETVIKKRMEWYEKTYGNSKMKYTHMAQDLHITTGAARALLLTYEKGEAGLKTVNSELSKLGKTEMNWTDMMSGRYENLEEALLKAGSNKEQQKKALKGAGLNEGQAKSYLEVKMDDTKSADKREAMLRDILRTATDPTAKAKDQLGVLRTMHDGNKTQEEIKAQLVRDYSITEDNKLAMDEANDIAKKVADGNTDVQGDLEQLGKLSSANMNDQVEQLKTSNSLLKDILDAVQGHLPKALADSMASARGGGPAAYAAMGVGALGVAGGAFFGRKAIARKVMGSNVMEALKKRYGGGGGGAPSKVVEEAAKTEMKAAESLENAAEHMGKTPGQFSLKSLEVGEHAAETTGEKIAQAIEKTEGKVHGGGKAGAVIKGALAIAATVMAFRSGDAKAATPEDEKKKGGEGGGESHLTKGLGTAANKTMWGEMALRAGGSVLGRAGLMTGAKVVGKIVPGLNIAMGVLSTAEQVSAMYDKHKRGESIGVGDWTKLGLRAASAVPVLGIPATVAEAGMDATGQFDKMNKGGTGGGLKRLGLLSMLLNPATAIPAFMMLKNMNKQDEEAGHAEDTADAAQDTADNTESFGDQLDQSGMATTLQAIKENTGNMSDFMQMQREQQVLRGGQLPAGGDFNAAASARSVVAYSSTSRAAGVDESKTGQRPSLDSRNGSSDSSMAADAATYNEAEDSVMVKFLGFGALQGMLKRREAMLTGQP